MAIAIVATDAPQLSLIPPALAGAGVVFAFMLAEYYSERRRKQAFRRAWGAETPGPDNLEVASAGNAAALWSFIKRHAARYGLVLFFVALALLMRWLLNPALKDRLPFTFFLGAVLLTARTAGLWKTGLALVLGFLAGTWFFAQPNSLIITESYDLWAAGLYFGIGAGLTFLMKPDRAAWLRTLRNDIAISKQMLVVRQKQTTSGSEADELLAHLAASAQEAIFSITAQGHVLTWNAAATRLLKYATAEIVGRPLAELIVPEQQAAYRTLLEQIQRGELPPRGKMKLIPKGGGPLEVWLTVSPVTNSTGKLLGASVIVREW